MVERACPKCCEMINRKAKVCLYCGHRSSMVSALAAISASILAVLAVGSASGFSQSHPVATSEVVTGQQTGFSSSAGKSGQKSWTVRASQFSQLQTGLTYDQAVDIIGSQGEEMSSSDLGGMRTVMVGWKNWDGTNMSAMFQNDKLVIKSQFGLR